MEFALELFELSLILKRSVKKAGKKRGIIEQKKRSQ